MMRASSLTDNVHSLDDLELAVLLGLVAQEHCIIRVNAVRVDQVIQDLEQIAGHVFNLGSVVINCDHKTTIGSLTKSLLAGPNSPTQRNDERKSARSVGNISSLREGGPEFASSDRQSKAPNGEAINAAGLANCVILRGLSQACQQVQIQILELMRTKRIFAHTAVHTAPKLFILIIVLLELDPVLLPQLNDRILNSLHVGEMKSKVEGLPSNERPLPINLTSPARASEIPCARMMGLMFSEEDIKTTRDLKEKVTLHSDMRTYLHNIIIFLRRHRAIAGGVSPLATRHLELVARYLASLHGSLFVTPTFIQLAASKVYSHRISLATAESERNLQYGSNHRAINTILDGVTPANVIYEVLEQVEVPV